MKKIIVLFALIFVLMGALLTAVSAEESVTDTVTEEAVTQVPTDYVTAPPDVSEPQGSGMVTTEMIVNYLTTNYEWLSVCLTMILTVIYQIRKHKVLNRSIGTLNNNAITVAENSRESMQNALNEMGNMSSTVGGYKSNIDAMLAAYQQTAEENKGLKQTLNEVHAHLVQSKRANVEFANELAELLVLANIPNSKKDELYARHVAAVKKIDAMDTEATDGQAEEK